MKLSLTTGLSTGMALLHRGALVRPAADGNRPKLCLIGVPDIGAS